MKKITLMALVALLLSISDSVCLAQKSIPTVSDLLINKKWETSSCRGCTYITQYEKYVVRSLFTYDNKNREFESAYYLSDTIDWHFTKMKVGLFPNGKYIIMQGKEKVSVYEILKINADSLVTKFRPAPGELYIGTPPFTVYTLQKESRKWFKPRTEQRAILKRWKD